MQTNFLSAVPIVQPARWVAVVPSDTVDLPEGVCKGLYINGGGVLVFLPANNTDSEVVTINVADGTYQGGFVRRVKSTSNTATGIWALY